MKPADQWQSDLSRWLHSKAYPLWTGIGVDQGTGTVWEALDNAGAPKRDMTRRLRVQVRQAFCFAQSPEPAHHALALQLFRFAMDKGFDPETENLAATLAPDLAILSAPHDLYDIAFMLMAAAALIEAGVDVSADLERLERELARLKAPRGWFECAAHALPRRQNPHMHLFEASTLLLRATGAARFRGIAEECLGLFRDVFLREDGAVLEYFDADWMAWSGPDQAVEPGHMAEWIYLLDLYEHVSGAACGVDLQRVFDAVLARRDAAGDLPDRTEPQVANTRRLWPQTELLKAALAARRRGLQSAGADLPQQVLARMWSTYFETPVSGGWYDKRDVSGALMSDTMPASTFYHSLVAVTFFLQDGVHFEASSH